MILNLTGNISVLFVYQIYLAYFIVNKYQNVEHDHTRLNTGKLHMSRRANYRANCRKRIDTKMEKILVVDNDLQVAGGIQKGLETEGYKVFKARNSRQALKTVLDNDIDLAIVDTSRPKNLGIGLMERLHLHDREIPVIILSAEGSINDAINAVRKGAANYLTKPIDQQKLLLQLKKSLNERKICRVAGGAPGNCDTRFGFDNIIGNNSGIKQVLKQAAKASETDSNVHIEGESGTGKELIAKSLHLASRRRNEHFVAINCAAIPETLLESELFGYKKGAFTGAVRDKRGLFAQAHEGSFFLDEISEMPLSMQSKLLRVLEEREYYPLGANETQKVDTRIITASHRDLEREVKKGNFREDLYYRIHVISIKLPPLRERKEDITLLARHFLHKYNSRMEKRVKRFSTAALQRLISYSWPGNVRELENSVERAVALAGSEEIDEELLLPKYNTDSAAIKPLKEARDDFMKNYLLKLMEFTNGNVSRAAKLAGKYRADLYDLLKRYNMNPGNFRKRT